MEHERNFLLNGRKYTSFSDYISALIKNGKNIDKSLLSKEGYLISKDELEAEVRISKKLLLYHVKNGYSKDRNQLKTEDGHIIYFISDRTERVVANIIAHELFMSENIIELYISNAI